MIAAARATLGALHVERNVEERLLLWLGFTDVVDLDAVVLGQLLHVSAPEAERIAEALAQNHVFQRREVSICVHEGCAVALSPESLEERRCRTCGAELDEFEPRADTRYVIDRPRARDLGWLIALHGIRTRGPWQEQLQWLVDRQFLRTVPFKNWKYGRILFCALVPALQRRVVRRFLREVKRAQSEVVGVLRPGPGPPPDVVAHSFGSWIVARALRDDPTLQLGHLVLVGSIVRPDWPWAATLERKQITGLLNYCGDSDPWVQLAERFIPDSGPSGSRGFTEQHDQLLNVLRPSGTHFSAFSDGRLPATFEDVWRPFLSDRWEDIDASEHQVVGPRPWAQAPVVLRAPTVLFLAVALLAAIVSAVVAAL